MAQLIAAENLMPLSQSQLNVDSKERSNLFPWRGQFTPEFVENLLRRYGKAGMTVFDPFAGVGTTLIESAKLGMRGRGTELNPSAFLMAQTVEWVRFSLKERESYLCQAADLLQRISGFDLKLDGQAPPPMEHAHRLAEIVKNPTVLNEVKQIVANVLIRGLADSGRYSKAFAAHSRIVRNLPESHLTQLVFHADARSTPLAAETVDLVITSPPYINVFNYHENNRQAMELLGWDILSVAKAELGSNRKNRGNRFFTVVQYCLDMREVLTETARVLKSGGLAILVVGKQSMVRGVAFENGDLVRSLAESCGFEIELQQSRNFMNRFGKAIFEDILHISRSGAQDSENGRQIALNMLRKKVRASMPDDVRGDIEACISYAETIRSSPIYKSW